MSDIHGLPINIPPATKQAGVRLPGLSFQVMAALLGGLLLSAAFLVAVLIGYNVHYAGKIFPGVTVAGVNLTGLTLEEASIRLGEELTYPVTGRIAFQGEQMWVAAPAEVGLFIDIRTSALAAYNLGRQGSILNRLQSQFRAWRSGQELSPLLVYDARVAQTYLEQIASKINQPSIEASLEINGVDVVVHPGQVGRQVDITATLAPLEDQLRSLQDGILHLIIVEKSPAILDASQQAAIAQEILSSPLTIQVPQASKDDPGPWVFDTSSLAEMIAIERVKTSTGEQYQVVLRTESLEGFLQNIASDLDRKASNARFIFNDETRQLDLIEPSITGRKLDIAATIKRINEKLSAGEHQVDLVLEYNEPPVNDQATAEKLGISELVRAETSYFYGSSTARIQNIQTAASRFHGVLVPPGATFSMADILGDVSLDNGYAEALIIFGNRTIKGVGGGVCQVSTTLFRTVFFSGLPIVERHSHAYRVSYYELTRSGSVNPAYAGLDATVYVPVVDFKFTNDTPYWLLMETYVNVPARSLTWKFYSTSDGRTVDWETTGLLNVVKPPKPLYQENPDLKKGEIKQVDWEAAGADVTIYRTVQRDGQVYLQDTFSTHYMPWRAVYEYGPGTKIPKDKKKKNP